MKLWLRHYYINFKPFGIISPIKIIIKFFKASLKILTVGILFVLVFSCKNKTSLDSTINDFANTECRAMQLRSQRFKLADNIRFTQDSIIQKSHSGDTLQLHEKITKMFMEKELLFIQSSRLSDSIKVQLDLIMSTYLTDKNKELTFNRKLDSILIIKGCK